MCFFNFLKEIEHDKWSFSRISGSVLLVFYMVCGWHIVEATNKIPDIPQWLGITILSLYGINRIACPTKRFIAKNLNKSLSNSPCSEKKEEEK
ncbi:MAG: hypothetical protein GXO57_01825 [Thermodesulfobacteria bacterium]|nr:hypothetical protein [Thermodesulfobacteriota bacterium]